MKEIRNKFSFIFYGVFDLLFFYVSLYLAYITRLLADKLFPHYLIKLQFSFPDIVSLYWIPMIYIFSFIYENLYTKHSDYWEYQKRIFKAVFLATLIIFAIVSISKSYDQISRAFIIILAVTSLVVFSIFRPIVRKTFSAFGLDLVRAIVIDNPENIKKLKNSLEKDKFAGFKIVNYVSNPKDLDITNKNGVDAIIINENYMSQENFTKIYGEIIDKVSFIYIVPNLDELPILNSELEYFNMGDIYFFRVKNNLSDKINQSLKRIFDLTLSILILPLFIILFLFIAILIKLTSPGPILFKQVRIGRNGKPIVVYKFRTMYVDADKRLKELLEKDEKLRQEWETIRKLKNDPRITPIGKFLRKISLDELPQILNVIKGDMSFVGPRPVLKEEIEKYYKEYAKFYYLVKPGITGLWQVSGRNNIDYNRRVELDTFYVVNWSLWLDIFILIKTIKVLLKKEGAY